MSESLLGRYVLAMQPAWFELDEAERDTIWDRFEHRFAFRPHIRLFPGFDEPADSTTFSISGVFGDESRYEQTRRACESAFVEAVSGVVASGDFIYALDWQHPAYRFWPHRPIERDECGDWTVPFIPDGDYYCFVDRELRFGTLGHPWEQTLCVFGDQLLAGLEAVFIDLLGSPIRRGGRDVRDARSRGQ
jgi:Protein of unknown function (DUF2716)